MTEPVILRTDRLLLPPFSEGDLAPFAALECGLTGAALPEIVAFTTTLNVRSQAVMTRLGMRRDLEGDFDHPSVPEGSPLRRHVLFRMVAS